MDLIALFENYVPPVQTESDDDSMDLLFDEFFEDFMKETDYRTYLQKESLIQSLVRTKKKKLPGNGSEYQRFLESLNYEKLNLLGSTYKRECKIMDTCYRHVVAPLLEEMEDVIKNYPSGVIPSVEIPSFHRIFPEESYAVSKANGNEHYLIHLCMADKIARPTISLSYKEVGHDFKVLLPLSGKLKKRFCWTSRKIRHTDMPYTTIIDGTCISKRVFIHVAKKLFLEYLGKRAVMDARSDVAVGETLDYIRSRLSGYRIIQDDLLIVDVDVCEKYGYDVAHILGACLDLEVLVRPCEYGEGLKERHLGYFYFFIDAKEPGLNSSDLYCECDVAIHFLMHLLRELYEEKRREQYERNLADSASRVFETKKNIPDKYLKAMAESKLNEMFGYVEIDEDCDLSSICEIEKEFLGFKQEFFKDQTFKDHSIRFRKLGRHHAAGLYFPSIRCLCVDIRMPYSFIHEYLHMIDHSVADGGEDHSARLAFYAIRRRYEIMIREWMAQKGDSDKNVQVLKGNTKYNLSYYLEPTEIFARCGEMYFKRVIGVKSSLLGEASGFAYPEDEQLMKMIGEYFDSLFGSSMERKAQYEAKVS